MFDCLVIGKGPAGVSAAVYMKRAGLNVAVVAKDGGALEKAEYIENYYGIVGISGKNLIEQGVAQLKSLGITVFDDEIMNVEKLESFTSYGKINSYSSKTVLLAIGSKRESLKISGMERFEGFGVSYCVTCDGFLYRKKRVGIVGDGDYMLHELESLKRFCPAENITVFSQGKELELDGIKQVKSKITSLEGKERLETVVVGNERYEIDGLFVAVGSAGGVEFAKKIGIEYSDGILTTDENCMTSLDGLYAAGDCKNKLKQISTAVADGTVAAMAIIKKTRRR